jgi:long-chain fatty acid transport protein
MKRSIKIAVAAAMALSTTSAFATNGDHLIGMGAKARGMGGIGIGMSHGAESALSNPALISSVKGTEISFGGTVFMPDVATNMGAGYASSDADLSVIPEVAIAQNLGNGITWGIGMYGTAGMGTDYRDATGPTSNMNMVTNLQLMQFAVPLAYSTNGFSVGIAPVLQYGSLDMNYDAAAFGGGVSETEGVAQDLGMGYNVGAAYEMAGVTVGASYKSAIDMEYKGQLNAATSQFNTLMVGMGASFPVLSDNLEQPAEMGIGASYTMGGHTVAADYKKIKWSDAKGYKDFGWEDQNVYMIGYQFAQNNWAVRAGYNHASNPIKEANGATPQGALLNVLNLLGFPAIVEDHYTVGGSYAFSKTTSLDLAYVYVPEVTETYSTAAFGPGLGMTEIKTKHSQDSVSVQLNFNF